MAHSVHQETAHGGVNHGFDASYGVARKAEPAEVRREHPAATARERCVADCLEISSRSMLGQRPAGRLPQQRCNPLPFFITKIGRTTLDHQAVRPRVFCVHNMGHDHILQARDQGKLLGRGSHT